MKKKRGNGEGSLYYIGDVLVFQYYEPSGKRRIIKQRKKETKKDFKNRVTEIKASLNQGKYIEKCEETPKSIIEGHIRQKYNDGITKGTSYNRDKETLRQLEKCCDKFINKPIQEVTLNDIQLSKEEFKKYASSGINRMWRLLKKAFSIAASPSINYIPYNIMNDENLRKPVANKKTKKVEPLSKTERQKLSYVLDNEERNHKYRNIMKMEWITGMRIGEVLARSRDDITQNKTILKIHNTLTKDENGNIIIGEHTKTYNKATEIDEGKREMPIFNELEEIIDEELSKKVTNMYGLLFWDYQKNTYVSKEEINAWLRRINQKYKICEGNLHNHRLRHDRLTQWKEQKMDIQTIQYFAGHVEGSEITEKVYIDISPEYAKEEFKKIYA